MTTDEAAGWIVNGALTTPESRWAVLAPTREMTRPLLDRLIDALPEKMIDRVRRSWPTRIDLNNGATITMLSGSPRAFNRGYSLDGAWLHLIEVNGPGYNEILPALMHRGGGFVESP